MDLFAPVGARVAVVPAHVGSVVRPTDPVVILEVMKMEYPVVAGTSGTVSIIDVSVGDRVEPGDRLAGIVPDDDLSAPDEDIASGPGPSLAEVEERHRLTLDSARPDAMAARKRGGRRSARENIDDLCESFVEYGALAVAAQRGRRELADLMANTPADGMIGGIGRIDTGTRGDDRALVVSYDFTVLAGTQGAQNHRKKDRLFSLAAEAALPVVLFAEGGGGRPGDVDWPGVSLLDTRAFRLFAEIETPTIGINTGYCFAGNAALLGQCDVVIATLGSNLGMGGPAMIEGGGLGRFEPTEIGPVEVQSANGVLDVVVDDDGSAVAAARTLLGYARGSTSPGTTPDQGRLRTLVPANRREIYDMRSVIEGLADEGSFIELRRSYASAAITGFARIEGKAIGVIANDPTHLAGAIDHAAADTLTRHLRLCDRWGVPVLSLCDTPGFMVGPDAERDGLARSAGAMFRAAAALAVPLGTIVTRRGYGLGAMAMSGGGFHEGRFTIGWPDSEFGAMGVEGAVRLGFKQELAAIADDGDREVELKRRIDRMYEEGRGLNVASHFEIDDVIDPAESRSWALTCLF